jgi:transposase
MQDGRRLRRYERRWIVERFFAWMQWRRRLLVRWESDLTIVFRAHNQIPNLSGRDRVHFLMRCLHVL